MTRNAVVEPTWTGDPDDDSTARTGLPVAVIGAGPGGLATAAHLLEHGLEPLVLEAGFQVGANIAQWRHVRLFSPWRLDLATAGIGTVTVGVRRRRGVGMLPLAWFGRG